jgi:BTB/POZ domain
MSLSAKSFEFTWKIPEYCHSKLTSAPDTGINSSAYSVKCGNESFINYVLHLKSNTKSNGESNNQIDWVSGLVKIDNNTKSVYCHHIELGFLDSSGEKFGRSGHIQLISTKHLLGFPDLVCRSTLENTANNLLSGGTLTVYCRIEEMKNVLSPGQFVKCNCLQETTRIIQNRRRLISDLNTLMDDKTNCDLQITVKKQKIDAHRSILTARSPVFAAMLKHDMSEKMTNSVTISDIDAPVFTKMLQFMYTGDCDVGTSAEDLYAAADKYDIQDLKEMCEEQMQKNVNVDNAVRMLILSDARQSRNLKEHAIAFINQNAAALVKKPCWNELMKTHPHLITEIYMKGMGINIVDAKQLKFKKFRRFAIISKLHNQLSVCCLLICLFFNSS